MKTSLVSFAKPGLLAAVAALATCLAGCGGGGTPGGAGAAGTSSSAAAVAPSPTAGHAGTVSEPAGRAPGSSSQGLVPMWPFVTDAQVRQWQAENRSGGHQPWHLDAGQTALAFTRGYPGYVEVDEVTSTSIQRRDAHIGVGWRVTPSRARTVATLHLVRVGSGRDAPWVVVGSDDTRLTLGTPRYGSLVDAPLRVGGRAPRGGVLTVAVSTGGHLKAVEEFSVTAVRVG